MSKEIDTFIETVARLRAPGGCPWDREQNHKSILSCLLDESYEFFEAVENNDTAGMREELGDLLLQVVLHAQMAAEAGTFTMDDVAREINEKLVRRHPHVFGDIQVSSTHEVLKNWEHIKKGEKKHRKYLTDDIPDAVAAPILRGRRVWCGPISGAMTSASSRASFPRKAAPCLRTFWRSSTCLPTISTSFATRLSLSRLKGWAKLEEGIPLDELVGVLRPMAERKPNVP